MRDFQTIIISRNLDEIHEGIKKIIGENDQLKREKEALDQENLTLRTSNAQLEEKIKALKKRIEELDIKNANLNKTIATIAHGYD